MNTPRRATMREVARIPGFQLAVAAILTVALCIVTAYLVVRYQIDEQSAAAMRAAAKLAASQHAQDVATCKALMGMDNAKNGIVFSPATKTGSAEKYVLRLVTAIHNVYVSTGCAKLLGG